MGDIKENATAVTDLSFEQALANLEVLFNEWSQVKPHSSLWSENYQIGVKLLKLL